MGIIEKIIEGLKHTTAITYLFFLFLCFKVCNIAKACCLAGRHNLNLNLTVN